jgi:hypothetical protein
MVQQSSSDLALTSMGNAHHGSLLPVLEEKAVRCSSWVQNRVPQALPHNWRLMDQQSKIGDNHHN